MRRIDCFETPPKPTQRRVCFPRLQPGRWEIDLECNTVRAVGVKPKDRDVVLVEDQDHWCPPIVIDSQDFPIAVHTLDQPDAHIGDTLKQTTDDADAHVNELLGGMLNTDGDELTHHLTVPPPALPFFRTSVDELTTRDGGAMMNTDSWRIL